MKWDKYKGLIISLHKEGLSSTQIRDVLAETVKKKLPRNADRTIRRKVNEWVPSSTVKEGASPARVLIFDIETAPLTAFAWRAWKENISGQQVITDWYMISWAAKWLFEDEIMSMVQTSKEAKNNDDARITRGLWELINEADVIIAHNALKFDIKRMNTRFLINELGLPSPYEVIDTLAHARKKFSLTHNRLDYIAKLLGFEGKYSTDFSLWERAFKGDAEALKEMDDYCKQDIRVLEDVYLHLRPYIQPHPNIGMHVHDGEEHCPSCGSHDLRLSGTYNTTVNVYDALQCNSCGSWSRRRRAALTVKQRQNILSSTPK